MLTLYRLNKYIYDSEFGSINTKTVLISIYSSQRGKHITDLVNSTIIEFSYGLYYINVFLNYYNNYYNQIMINFSPVKNIKDTRIVSITFNFYKCKEIEYYYSDSVIYKFNSPKKKVILHKFNDDYSWYIVYEYNKLKRITMIKTHGLYKIYKFKFEEELAQIDIIDKHNLTRYVKC